LIREEYADPVLSYNEKFTNCQQLLAIDAWFIFHVFAHGFPDRNPKVSFPHHLLKPKGLQVLLFRFHQTSPLEVRI